MLEDNFRFLSEIFYIDKKIIPVIVEPSGEKWGKVEEKMFIGEYRHRLDEKNRLTIPSSFRQILEREKDGCIVTKGLDKSLFLYPFSEWQRLGKRLKNLSINRSEVRAFLRIFFSGAHPVQPDGQGRITIPQSLKEFAEIKEKVAVIGAFNKVEIWSEEAWDDYYNQKKGIYEQLTEKIMDLEI